MVICPFCERKIDTEKGLRIHVGRCHKGKTLPNPDDPLNNGSDKRFSIPLQTILQLSGESFFLPLNQNQFTLVQSEGLFAKVVWKEFQQLSGKTFLFCSVFRSGGVWAIPEEDVLLKKHRVISLGEDIPEEIAPLLPNISLEIFK